MLILFKYFNSLVDFIELAGDEMYNESSTCPVSQEVKDMWDCPVSSEKIPYTLPKITIVDIVMSTESKY